MTQLSEAISRYHKMLEGDPQKTAGWAAQLRATLDEHRLTVNGRPVSPVLRPHFLSRRQYSNLAKTVESLSSAIDRVRQVALASPALMARMGLLPAEKMLASLDPGYSISTVSSLLDSHVNNGSVHFTECRAELPNGVVYGELLADLYYETAPVKEFRKKYKLEKTGGTKPLIQALLKAYKEFARKGKPNIAVLEFKHPFQTAESLEYQLLVELFRKHGFQAELVTPDQLEYKAGILRHGEFPIDLVYRGVKAHEFLLRFDLNHPLVRAYRERKVCIVNSFRSELTRKKALFDLLTDDVIVASFPAAEKKAIRESIPWTRVVAQAKTVYQGDTVDLPQFILDNRETLVLRPNDESSEQHSVDGHATDEAGWERALKIALRSPYVVQERLEPHPIAFPVDFYGDIVMRDFNVDVHPHTFVGKVHGCSSTITPAAGSGFSSLSGLAPTFILDVK
jgi:hypothetical protein